MAKLKNSTGEISAPLHEGGLGLRTYSSTSLHGQVVHELGKRIVSGAIAEGEVLPVETELGAEFDVSRTALREGIKVLTAKGLLASRTRTGTRVRPRDEWNMLDPDVLAWRLETGKDENFIQDLYDFRMAVEPVAASLAASRATDDDIADMKVAIEDMEAAGQDTDAFTEPDLHFHLLVFVSCKNDFLASLSALIETAVTFTFRMADVEIDSAVVELHRNVFEAIRDRDSARAHAGMVVLLNYARDRNEVVLAQIQAEKNQ